MQNLTPEERNQIEICISSVQSLQLRKQTEDIPPLLKPDWENDFEVDWDDLSKDILYQLNNGKKLTPRDKREFVRFLGKCIMNFCPRPKRKNIVGIVQKVVNKFPNSLSDTWCEETAGVGYEGLLRRVIYRIENLNRNMYSYTPKSDPEGKKKRTPSYKFYGCTNWQPMIFDYETHVLEQKRESLKERFGIEGKAFDSVSSDLMRETYKLQRKDINEGNDISKLMFEWPYLFTIEGLLGHFSELVGIDLRSKLEKTLSTKGNMIFTHLSKISDRPLKNEKLKTTMFELLMEKEGAEKIISDVSGLLTIIAEYFEERKESLYMVMESSLSQKEIERILNLQDVFSPLIVVRGTSPVSYESCMLCVNRKVLIEEIGSFKDAFLGLFCLFYCLNIEYPVSAVATLEFVQRCFFNINASGSKCQKRSKWRMNMKVTKLIEMLSEYD